MKLDRLITPGFSPFLSRARQNFSSKQFDPRQRLCGQRDEGVLGEWIQS